MSGYQAGKDIESLRTRLQLLERACNIDSLRSGAADFSVIVGHGQNGVIICGTGQTVDGTDKYIGISNPDSWQPCASPGVPGTCRHSRCLPRGPHLPALRSLCRATLHPCSDRCRPCHDGLCLRRPASCSTVRQRDIVKAALASSHCFHMATQVS
jgi:hypothetical protein